MEKNNEFVDNFHDLLIFDICDLGLDFANLTLDDIDKHPILNQIPFLKLFLSSAKTIISITDRFLLKKTLRFVSKLQLGNLSKEDIEKFDKRFKDKSKRMAEVERLLVLLDKQIEIEKIDYIANLFAAWVHSKISNEEFRDYTEILDKILTSDICAIGKIWQELNSESYLMVPQKLIKNLNRLSNQGIGSIIFFNENKNKTDYGEQQPYQFDEFSQKFINIILGKSNFKIKNIKKIDTIQETVNKNIKKIVLSPEQPYGQEIGDIWIQTEKEKNDGQVKDEK